PTMIKKTIARIGFNLITTSSNLARILFRLQRVSYSICDLIQFPPFGFVRVMRAKSQAEPITRKTGKYVQMSVKYFLPRRLAVCEEEIYPFTLEPALAQRRGNTLRDAKHLSALFLIQFYKVTGMPVGNYKHVSWIDGLNVHKN